MAEAAIGKQDFELLAGLPGGFADDRDELAINLFRLYTYRGGQCSHQLIRLSTEVRHALVILAERSSAPSLTRGDVFHQAAETGLPGDHGHQAS
ncbi:hypothetical protein [Streptomyces rugosispiralis]|uniref:Uncharacterized protein n=1 Tax=Streptomyces rugosispiralis TaxID=2967341 RepID=A0ABT1V5D1_9ACTN|nr:hypothetical protein [Streptomyces rugosispiralis]MCQ8192596.1 hypothetical protein [Streptomyces rugosispiralis]